MARHLYWAKNEQRVIEKTVRNFFQINYDKFYVWVIDDASTDATPSVLEQLQNEFPRLRVVRHLVRIPASRLLSTMPCRFRKVK